MPKVHQPAEKRTFQSSLLKSFSVSSQKTLAPVGCARQWINSGTATNATCELSACNSCHILLTDNVVHINHSLRPTMISKSNHSMMNWNVISSKLQWTHVNVKCLTAPATYTYSVSDIQNNKYIHNYYTQIVGWVWFNIPLDTLSVILEMMGVTATSARIVTAVSVEANFIQINHWMKLHCCCVCDRQSHAQLVLDNSDIANA